MIIYQKYFNTRNFRVSLGFKVSFAKIRVGHFFSPTRKAEILKSDFLRYLSSDYHMVTFIGKLTTRPSFDIKCKTLYLQQGANPGPWKKLKAERSIR